MSKLFISDYTFTPGAAGQGTIVLDGSYAQGQFYSIRNKTTGDLLYLIGDPDPAIAVVVDNGVTTITLDADTSSHSSTDNLQIAAYSDDFRWFGSSLSSTNGSTSSSYQSIVSITRPNNTIAYTANDVIGGVDGAIITFPNIGATDGFIMLTRATLSIALTSIPSGMTGFNLHLFNAAPAAIADNDPRAGNANDRTKLLRTITFFPSDQGSYLFSAATITPNDCHFKLIGSSLFGLLETLGAYTPAANTIYTLLLNSIEV